MQSTESKLLNGPPDKWDDMLFDSSGGQDIINYFFSGNACDPHVLTAGVSQVLLETSITERLDKLLGSLESVESVCGNGTMVTIIRKN